MPSFKQRATQFTQGFFTIVSFQKTSTRGFRRWTAGVLQAQSEHGSSPVTAARPRGCETAMPTFFLAELRQRRRQKCGQISEAVSNSFSIFALQQQVQTCATDSVIYWVRLICCSLNDRMNLARSLTSCLMCAAAPAVHGRRVFPPPGNLHHFFLPPPCNVCGARLVRGSQGSPLVTPFPKLTAGETLFQRT